MLGLVMLAVAACSTSGVRKKSDSEPTASGSTWSSTTAACERFGWTMRRKAISWNTSRPS